MPLKIVFPKNFDYLQLFPQSMFLAQDSHLLILSKDLTICRAYFWPYEANIFYSIII